MKGLNRCYDNSCHYSISECKEKVIFDFYPTQSMITLQGVETNRILLTTRNNNQVGFIQAPQCMSLMYFVIILAKIHELNLPVFMLIHGVSMQVMNSARYRAMNHTRLEELHFLPRTTTQIVQNAIINEEELYLSTPAVSIGSILNITFIDMNGQILNSLQNPIQFGLFYQCHTSIMPRIHENVTFYKNPLDVTDDEHCLAKYNEELNEWFCLEDMSYRFERCLIVGALQEAGVYSVIFRPKDAKGLYEYVPATPEDPYRIFYTIGFVIYIILVIVALYVIVNR